MTSVFVTSVPTLPGRPVRGMFSPFSAGMILDGVRRLAVRHLPEDVAGVEIDRADAAVRRLDERQPLNRQRRDCCRLPSALAEPEPPERRAPVSTVPW